MNEGHPPLVVLERTLATTLRQGTRIATAVVILGLGLAWFKAPAHAPHGVASMPVVSFGILLFMLLPTARVGLMMLAFLRVRDYRFAAIAAVVLVVIALGFAFSMAVHTHTGA